MTDDYTNPEIARALVRIEEGQKDLAKKVDALADKFVTADVFALRVGAVERDVKEIKTAADSRRPSAWTITTGLAALTAVGVTLIPILAK
jgi:anti-sigma factor RsiW